MSDRVEMTVKMQVTPSQGLALRAMFEHWNKLACLGSSRNIAFYVDGDGNFRPQVEIILPDSIPELTDEMRDAAMVSGKESGHAVFDFDPIAWMLHD